MINSKPTEKTLLEEMIHEPERNPILDKCIQKITDAVAGFRQSDRKVFEAFLYAFNSLTHNDFCAFKKCIDLEKTTIRKMSKVCENKAVMRNSEQLPESWGTLYDISRFQDDYIEELIKCGKLNPDVTRAEVQHIHKEISPPKKAKVDQGKPQENHDNQVVPFPKKANALILTLKLNATYTDDEYNRDLSSVMKTLEKYFYMDGDILDNFLLNKKEAA